jgi:alcohol dehydrogenase class IV
MMFRSFDIARLPQIVFGGGRILELPGHIATHGRRALFVFGRHSFRSTPTWAKLQQDLRSAGIDWKETTVAGEPSPELVDAKVVTHKNDNIDVVVGLGGGSVLDAAKAIAGLLRPGNSVMDHLEGVGRGVPYRGPAVPLIAVPTTAGTGSEATKNAVLSKRGEDGFKKSFRDDRLVARVALVDPDLLISCPPELIAANGMDAFTQLLESYVSTHANPMTDALALSGIEAFRDGFWTVWEQQSDAAEARARLAYASMISGITLAQTGLGSVHGMASPLGAFFPAPHGVVCGTLVAEATDMNIRALRQREPDDIALQKYADVGRLLSPEPLLNAGAALTDLVERLRQWTERLRLPKLSRYGMRPKDLDRVAAHSGGSSMKTNPLVLRADELKAVLQRRL